MGWRKWFKDWGDEPTEETWEDELYLEHKHTPQDLPISNQYDGTVYDITWQNAGAVMVCTAHHGGQLYFLAREPYILDSCEAITGQLVFPCEPKFETQKNPPVK